MNPVRRGGMSTRVQMRKGLASAPAPLETNAPPPQPDDYAEFLRMMLPQQKKAVASHRFGTERVWIKKAGPRHGMMRYRLQAAISAILRLDVLAPVPNPGGEAALVIEARRLYQLGLAGLRVPMVLAQQTDGLMISDLGESGRA